MALCPLHDEKKPSLSLYSKDGRDLLKCHSCGQGGSSLDLEAALTNTTVKDLLKDHSVRIGARGARTPSVATATVHRSGCTLAELAEAKGLPVDTLRFFGLSDTTHQGKPAVRIPYLDASGRELSLQYRIGLEGDDRFRWKSGNKATPYGLTRLDDAKKAGYLKRTSAIQEFEQLIELSLDAESYGDDGPRTLALEVDRKRQLRITERQRAGDPLKEEYFAWAVNKEFDHATSVSRLHAGRDCHSWLRKERRTTFVKASPGDLSAYLESERERLLNHSKEGSPGVFQEALMESCEENLEYTRVSMHNVYDFLEEKGLVGKNPMDGLVSA